MNLAAHFLDRNPPDKTAILYSGAALTYGDVAAQSAQAANGLRALGVRPGDRVLLLLPDSPEFAAAWFGAILAGAVAVPTNTSLRTADYAHFLHEADPRVVILHSAIYPHLEPILSDRTAIVTGDPIPGRIWWNEWHGEYPAFTDPFPSTENDAAFWLWTSGSTGSPKAAVHGHADWIACCEGYARGVLGMHAGDLVFSTSKLFHAYGLGNGLMFPFYAGATAALFPGRPQARAVLEFTERIRPSLFFSVPTLYAAMLHETDAANPYDLSSIRLAVSAAEPLPADLYRRWRERFGAEILDGIGSTEVLHIYISSRPGAVKPGSTGQAVPGYQIRITGEQGRELPAGQAGELWVRGASNAAGYWNRPALTSERMRDGWFFSGDKYTADADGYYWYAGRSDDMFRVLGEWVSPIEIEAALIGHAAVLECAVVAYKDEDGLSKPKACVVLKEPEGAGEALAEELRQFVRERIAGYKCPRRVEFLDELPKTPTGKIQRYKLRGAAG